MTTPGPSLLLVLPVAAFERDGRLFIDDQAANGLQQWLDHFGRLTLCVKVWPGEPGADCVALDTLGLGDRLAVERLPTGWTPLAQLRAWRTVKRQLSELIDRHDYLQFALMGGWGDWATLGALLAAARGRKASVWTDRVESAVLRGEAQRYRGLRRLSRRVNSLVAGRNEARAIRAASLGLFHGKDTFDHFSRYSRQPCLVHDIHLKPQDRIPPEQLAEKLAACRTGPLKIIYVGRVHPDKGVSDWIAVLERVRAAGSGAEAQWFGAGPQLDEARAMVEAAGLSGQVSFPGPVFDRAALLAQLRDAHLMLFCHLTPESPRCLIEALVSGTPIVGYGSSYSEDLIAEHGGGVLTTMDPVALADQVCRLASDRGALADLIGRAAADGHEMNDAAVFAHRSELMKQYS